MPQPPLPSDAYPFLVVLDETPEYPDGSDLELFVLLCVQELNQLPHTSTFVNFLCSSWLLGQDNEVTGSL